MMRGRWLSAVAVTVACAMTAMAQQELGRWRADNNTARSTTGEVTIGPEKIVMNFYAFSLARIRTLEPGEVTAVFDMDSANAGQGALYRTMIPAKQKFLGKNTICGLEDTEWVVAFAQGRSLQLAFFSGEKQPVFTFDAITNSTNLCGIYTYVK